MCSKSAYAWKLYIRIHSKIKNRDNDETVLFMVSVIIWASFILMLAQQNKIVIVQFIP